VPRWWPWPLPCLLGATVGIALTTAGAADRAVAWQALSSLVAVLVAASGVVLTLRPRAWIAPRAAAGLALVAVGVLIGGWRGAAWATAPDPWRGQLGLEVELSGSSDGSLLQVPGRGALVLRGADVPEGRVRLRGTLEALPGKRNPGGVDLRAHWRRRGAYAALRVAEVLAAPARASPRTALRRGVTVGLSARAAAVVQAMTLGLRDELGDLRETFAASGLAHVLALSGLHVGVLAMTVAALARWLPRGRLMAVIVAVWAYVWLVGGSPSVARAAMMVTAVALAAAQGRARPALLGALAAAALAGLLYAPGWLLDLGFQLSHLSVLGIGLVAPPLTRALVALPGAARRTRRGGPESALRAAWRAASAGVGVSVGAQVATGSLVASTFGALPLASPLANLAAVPLATLLVPLGFAAAVAGLVAEPLAVAVNRVVGPLAEMLVAVAGLAARGPSLAWGEVSGLGHVCYAVSVAALVAALHRRLAWRRALAALALAVAVTALAPPPFVTPELVVLDVGQGDAIVIRLGRASAVLVDGGGTPFGDFDVGARVVVPALRAMGVRSLAVVVATHADLDHVEGLISVLGTLPVGELWIGHPEPERPVFRRLMQVAAARGVPVREVRRGEWARVGSVRLDVVHPTVDPTFVSNDDSVGVLVRVGESPWALLLGDASAVVEADLPVPPVPVLVAPHHGSASSTSEVLLRAVTPRLVVVSVGENRFGHPAASVLARLEAFGIAVRTTRDEGAVRLPAQGL
jgi:competence protein ComEC